MIPVFPNFKKISIYDRTEVESYTHKYQAYSTFNFTNLWAWDTKSDRLISILNENLVIQFTDYKTSVPFLSFVGTNKLENSVNRLLRFAETSMVSPVLRFITEETIRNLQISSLYAEEDRDNFDYIFSVSRLADPQGKKLKEKRQLAKRFLREHPDASFELRELSDKSVQQQIVSVIHRWEYNKKSDNKPCSPELENKAIHRLLQTASAQKLILSCIFLCDVMIGFSIDELTPNGYAIAHFVKADNSYRGLYEFLNQKIAQYLLAHDVVFWNWQQDLNISGLRALKMTYQPVRFLKKFNVYLKPQNPS